MTVVIRPVIINYKGVEDTIECLLSLGKQKGSFSCEPIVLDNASNDGSLEKLRSAFPALEIIESPINTGFCGGNNIAIGKALSLGCDYVFILNNDTTLEAGCIQSLLECIQTEPNAGVVGPAIYYYDKPEVPWFTGSVLDVSTGKINHEYGDLSQSNITAPFDIKWSTGCAMLVPASILKNSGLFDERFFCYWEDVDLSQRIKRLGYRCILCPKARLYHKVSASSKKLPYSQEYYIQRNRLLFVEKHATKHDKWALLKSEFLTICRAVKYRKVHSIPEPIDFKVYKTATIDYTLRRFGKRSYNWE